MKLSEKAQELLEFLREEYKDNGYLYSGCWPYVSLRERGYDKEHIAELTDAGLIQRRDCDGYAFELPAMARGALIAKYSLCSRWYEKAGDALLEAIRQEARNAAGVYVDETTGLISVGVYKNAEDTEKPDRMTVYSPFSVGQVVNLEYDLPKRKQYSGYSHLLFVPGGKAVGQFMVTDIVRNLLFDPGSNMLEVQSLCEEFNRLYPNERTMTVFEDVLQKRLKEVDGSLEQKLSAAEELSAETDKGQNISDYVKE